MKKISLVLTLAIFWFVKGHVSPLVLDADFKQRMSISFAEASKEWLFCGLTETRHLLD